MRDGCLQSMNLKMLLPLFQGGVKMSKKGCRPGMKRLLLEVLIIVLASWRGNTNLA